jgi:uncharacterized DUF497 family protein
MVLITYNDLSLKKHKITRDQVKEAITDPMRAIFDMPERTTQLSNLVAEADSYRQMIVGYTHTNILLEVGIEMIADHALHIFHAQKISPQYYKLYEEWLKNG